MNEDPKRLLDDAAVADPELSARLRSDLRIAKGSRSNYDIEGGRARLSAAIAAGSVGGGHGGGHGDGHAGGSGSGSAGTGGVENGAGGAAGSGAATAGGALGVKVGVIGFVGGLVALGALVVGTGMKAPSSVPPTAAIALPAPITTTDPRVEAPPREAPPREVPAFVDPPGAPSSAGVVAPEARGAANVASAAGVTMKPEMDQLAQIRRALPSDPGRALALAEEGHARFPRGAFGQEREVAAINALVKLGRSCEARARARDFVSRHPESPYAEGLRVVANSD